MARLLPQEYAGTAEAAPTKGSPQERGTAQLVLLSKLVLYKLYTLVRIGHELKLEAPLNRRGVARILCEAIARPGRAKGLPAANTFCKNAFNPMPHQARYLVITPIQPDAAPGMLPSYHPYPTRCRTRSAYYEPRLLCSCT